MMTISERLFNMKYQGKEKVAKVGKNKGLYEYHFELDKVVLPSEKRKDTSLLEVDYIFLLPETTEKSFISVQEASNRSGISIKELKKLCFNGDITCITKGRWWFILDSSLNAYLSNRNEGDQTSSNQIEG